MKTIEPRTYKSVLKGLEEWKEILNSQLKAIDDAVETLTAAMMLNGHSRRSRGQRRRYSYPKTQSQAKHGEATAEPVSVDGVWTYKPRNMGRVTDRSKVLDVMRRSHPGGITPKAIKGVVGIGGSAVNSHLLYFYKKGIIGRIGAGKHVKYFLKKGVV